MKRIKLNYNLLKSEMNVFLEVHNFSYTPVYRLLPLHSFVKYCMTISTDNSQSEFCLVVILLSTLRHEHYVHKRSEPTIIQFNF